MEFWYSPGFILEATDLALAHCQRHEIRPPSTLIKAITESRAAAIFCFGLGRQLGVELWLRPADPEKHTPDVDAMYLEQVEESNQARLMDIEVATYTRHSEETLAEFMRRTKLDPTKSAYSSRTVFVFFIQRAMTGDIVREAQQELARHELQGLAFLLGRVDEDLFQVVKVYREYAGPDNVRISEILASTQTPVAEAKRGMSAVQRRSETPIPTDNPFLRYLD